MASSPIISWQIDMETIETVTDFILLGSKITPDGDCHHEIKRYLLLGREAMTNLDSILKSRDITLMTKVHLVKVMVFSSSQSYGVSSSHVWMWELDHKEVWAPKNWCFWTVVLEKTFESPLDSKEIKPVNPKGNWPWIFIGRTDAEAPVLWPPLKAGGEEDNRRQLCQWNHWHGWMASHSMNMSLSKLQEMVKDKEVWHAAIHRVGGKELDMPEWLNNKKDTSQVRLYSFTGFPFTHLCWYLRGYKFLTSLSYLVGQWKIWVFNPVNIISSDKCIVLLKHKTERRYWIPISAITFKFLNLVFIVKKRKIYTVLKKKKKKKLWTNHCHILPKMRPSLVWITIFPHLYGDDTWQKQKDDLTGGALLAFGRFKAFK